MFYALIQSISLNVYQQKTGFELIELYKYKQMKVGVEVRARRKLQHYTLSDPKYALIGIVSYLKGHKMAMSVNDDLGFNFQQTAPIAVTLKSDETISFPVFFDEDESNTTLFRLITNRSAQGILVRAFRQFDFLIQVEGDYAENFANRLLQSLRENEQVLASGILPTKKLKKSLLG